MCSLITSLNNRMESPKANQFVGHRKCGDVFISSDVKYLTLHCLFCEFDNQELNIFLNHLQSKHLNLVSTDILGMVPSPELETEIEVLQVKQETCDLHDTKAVDDTKLNPENEADPLMTEEKSQEEETLVLVKTDYHDEHVKEEELPLSSIIQKNVKCKLNASESTERPKLVHMLKIIDLLEEHQSLWNSKLRSCYIRAERQQAIHSITKKMQKEFPTVKFYYKYILEKVNKFKKMFFNFNKKQKMTKNDKKCFEKLHFLNGHAPTNEKKKECSLCHVVVSNLVKHMERRHQDNDIPQICKLCGEEQPSVSHLKMHLRGAHLRYECDNCDSVFVSFKSLKNHIEKTHADKSQLPIYAKEKLISECICEYCGRRFKTKQNLYNHKAFVHLQLRPYVCSECGKSFQQKQKLESHMNSIHLNQRTYMCNVCSKGFYDRKTLVQHIRIHSDDINYVCKVCGNAFRQAPALHSHMKTHRS